MLRINDRHCNSGLGAIRKLYAALRGPGGQNVNKVKSARELRFEPRTFPVHTDALKTRFYGELGRQALDD